MDRWVGVELRVVRIASTLLFFGSVAVSMVSLLGDPVRTSSVVAGVLGGVAFGLMSWALWRDDLNARANGREQETAATIRQQGPQQAGITWVAAPNQGPSTQSLPPGPSSPIQHSG